MPGLRCGGIENSAMASSTVTHLAGASSTSALEAFWKLCSRARGTSSENQLAITVGALVATLVVLYLLAQAQAQERKRLPPGPSPWPVLGNLLVMASRMPHRTLENLAAKYGGIMYLRLGMIPELQNGTGLTSINVQLRLCLSVSTSFFLINIVNLLVAGSRPCVVISTAAAVKEVFRQSNDAGFSNRPKGLFNEVFSDNYRTVVHAPYGPYWRQLRRFSSSELLSPTTVASYRGLREEELRNMMATPVEDSAKGEPINVKSWIFETNANIMTKMLVNKR
jgi:hypothetical protein